MADKSRIDVHAHLYPPRYLDTLRGGGPMSFGRDSEGREVLEMNGRARRTGTSPTRDRRAS